MIDDEADFGSIIDAPGEMQTAAKFLPKARAKPRKPSVPSRSLGPNPTVKTTHEKVGALSQDNVSQELTINQETTSLMCLVSKTVADATAFRGILDTPSEDGLTVSLGPVSNPDVTLDSSTGGVTALDKVSQNEEHNVDPPEVATHQENLVVSDTQASSTCSSGKTIDDLADFGELFDTHVEEERVAKFQPKILVKLSKAASKSQKTNQRAEASTVDVVPQNKEDGNNQTGCNDEQLKDPRHQESVQNSESQASLGTGNTVDDLVSLDSILEEPVQEETAAKFRPKLRPKPGRASSRVAGTNDKVAAAAPEVGFFDVDVVSRDAEDDRHGKGHNDNLCQKPTDQEAITVPDTWSPQDVDATVDLDSHDELINPHPNGTQSIFGEPSAEATVKFQPNVGRKKRKGKSVSFVLPDASEGATPTDTNSEMSNFSHNCNDIVTDENLNNLPQQTAEKHCITQEQHSNDREYTDRHSQHHAGEPSDHAVEQQPKLDVGETGLSMKLRSRTKLQKVGIPERTADVNFDEDYVEHSAAEQDNDSGDEYTAGGKQKVRTKSREKDINKEPLRGSKRTLKDSPIEESQQRKLQKNKSKVSSQGRKRTLQDTSTEQPEKKLTHRIRQKRIKEVKTLLETPDHEIDRMKLSVTHLRLLQEARERIKGKEIPPGPSSSNQSSQLGDTDDFDFFGDKPESGTLENNSSHQPSGINSCTRTYKGSHVVQADTIRTTNQCNFTRNGAELHQTAPVADNMCTDDKLDAMDDDEILATIDVDRIVMEHYQATNTPRGSASGQTSTPSGNKCNLNGLDENSLPQELSDICKHGFKLGFCPEAKNHLQEMKDQLIAVCNELIDGSGELSPQHSEELRQKRVHLKKQIQLLEEYMARSTHDDERQRSHSMAFTTAIQGHHPPMTPRNTFVMDTDRFQSQVYIRNETGNSGLCYSPAPYSYMDSLSTPLTSVQRDYTPRVIDISYTEGSGDKRWSSTDFPWTKELEVNNKRVFGNHSFRPNQREIINATMSGNDVFVLMPTGGGKSLTYQLPALIYEGITLVVSPLVSLIQDQIMHLLQANIPAAYLSASMEWSKQQEILRGLMSRTCPYKLLYVTPEKIAKSDALLRQLENVYSRGHLSRIVIDEAHCVSQWGHDFRPDYQHLGILKWKFPHTPVLALTATATASVKEDVVQVLGLANCIVFRQSFNRPNLRYYVRPKKKKCLADINSFIRANHPKECGIIYCLSRMDCEKVAGKLRECGHKALHYHGSMDPNNRAHVQRQWSMDKINIICATVAFGMGINKPDVRFVIHHSLPKSIEGYYQECGRAGRDGQLSSCVLYYNYSDYIRVKHMITQGRSSSSHEQALETHKENLLRMVGYCENDVDCRRLLQLTHFGEMFDPSHCAKTCDNCLKELTWIEKDVTNIARQLVELVMMTRQTCTTSHILEVYKGSVNQNVKKHRHDTLSLHGAGKHLSKGEAARIMRHLVTEEILIEDVEMNDNMYGSVSSVLKANQTKVGDLRSGKHNIVLKSPTPKKAPKMGKLDEPSVPQINKTVQQQSEVDENLASILYETLRCLRRQILEECPEGYSAHHIFVNETLREISNRLPRTKEELLEINGIGKVKLGKYGDRVLATIEDFLNKYPNASKKSSSNENTKAVKKRRGFTATNTSSNGDDFEERTVQYRGGKRAANSRNSKQGISDAASMVQDARCIDRDLDGCEAVDEELCSVQKPILSLLFR